MRKLFNDEAGFVVSAELVLVATIGVLAMVVGLASVRDAVLSELCDVASAFGAIDQSYNYRSTSKPGGTTKGHGNSAGSGYNDLSDDCDCKETLFSDVCGKTQGVTSTGE
jgi:hypothetical protein